MEKPPSSPCPALSSPKDIAGTSRYGLYKAKCRGGSRNVEEGVLILCRAAGSNFVLGPALRKAVYRGA